MKLLIIVPQFRKSDTNTSQRITVDGVTVRIVTYTNKIDGLWYHDVFDSEDVALLRGVRLTTGLDLWFPYRYLPLPPGPLFVADHEFPTLDPGLDSFLNLDATLYLGELN